MLGKASLLALLAASGLGQGSAAPSARDLSLFRDGLTATVIEARASDSLWARCRVVAVDWRLLPGATSYQVQTRVGARGTWVAVQADPRCGRGGFVGATSFQDRVLRPAPRRYYRVVALAPNGESLAVTAPVPVEVR